MSTLRERLYAQRCVQAQKDFLALARLTDMRIRRERLTPNSGYNAETTRLMTAFAATQAQS